MSAIPCSGRREDVFVMGYSYHVTLQLTVVDRVPYMKISRNQDCVDNGLAPLYMPVQLLRAQQLAP